MVSADGDGLHENEKYILDCDGISNSSPTPTVPAETPVATAVEVAPAAPTGVVINPDGTRSYTIQPNDGYIIIANKLGISVSEAKNLVGTDVFAGKTITTRSSIPNAPQTTATTIQPSDGYNPTANGAAPERKEECSTFGISPVTGGFHTEEDGHEDVAVLVDGSGCYKFGRMTNYEQLKYAGSGARVAIESVKVSHTLLGDSHCDASYSDGKLVVSMADGYENCEVNVVYSTPNGSAAVARIGNSKIVVADEVGGTLGKSHAPNEVVRADDPWGKVYDFDTLLRRKGPKVVGSNPQNVMQGGSRAPVGLGSASCGRRGSSRC